MIRPDKLSEVAKDIADWMQTTFDVDGTSPDPLEVAHGICGGLFLTYNFNDAIGVLTTAIQMAIELHQDNCESST